MTACARVPVWYVVLWYAHVCVHGAGGAPRRALVLFAGRGTGIFPAHSCRQDGIPVDRNAKKFLRAGTGSAILLPAVNTCACRGPPPAPWTCLPVCLHRPHSIRTQAHAPGVNPRPLMIFSSALASTSFFRSCAPCGPILFLQDERSQACARTQCACIRG